MNIVKWLAPSRSAVNGEALIMVEPNEVADIEKMLMLVDGNSVGHFGLKVELVGIEKEPSIKPAMWQRKPIGPGYYSVEPQFGFPCASEMMAMERYYTVFVHRD